MRIFICLFLKEEGRRSRASHQEESDRKRCCFIRYPFILLCLLAMIALMQYSMDNSCMDFQTFIMTEAYKVSQCLKCHENLY